MSKPAPDVPSSADDAAIASLGAMQRASPAMYARRRRILGETRRLMSEVGAEGFGMRELADRSGVSLRTLYNAFGSKEVLILAAIRQYYDKFLVAVTEQRNPYDFETVIDTAVALNLRNLQIRPYLAAVVSLYFSSQSGPEVRVELRRVGAGFFRPWLDVARARRQLRDGVDTHRVIANLAALQFAVNQEWLADDIDGAALLPVLLEAVYTYLAGVTQGEAGQRVEELLADVRGPRRLLDERVGRIESWLARLLGEDVDAMARPG